MKVKTSLLALAIVGFWSSPATAVLVARYSFDSDFSNAASLPGPAATPMNGATAGVAGGIVGNAMSLSTLGPNQHINVPISFGPSGTLGTEFTVSAWFDLNDSPAASGSGRYFIYESQTDFDISYGARDSGLGEPGFNDTQSFTHEPSVNQSFADGALGGWRHVAHTYSNDGTNTTITTYIDGVEAGTLATTVASVMDVGINFGAARNGTVNRGFDGLMDEIAIWDEALSPGQIARVYGFGAMGQTIPNVIMEPVVGDADGNNVVNEFDFFTISDNLSNTVVIGTDGDVDFDGMVTFNDFRVWKDVASPAALAAAGFGSAVPEPSTVVLLASLCAVAAAAYRRRQS
jgi:hypothetical protein